jgi:nitrate reductase NapE component
MSTDPRQAFILLLFASVAILSGAACYYFSLYRPRRPATTALVLVTAFVFWQDLLWGSLYAVAAMRDRAMSFDALATHLVWPILAVALLGMMGIGLLFLLIVRRELP